MKTKQDTRKATRGTFARGRKAGGFTDDERAAMQERARELAAEARRGGAGGDDGSASVVGLERVVGRIEGRSGSFVRQHVGVFEDGQAKESYSLVPGSATGDLRGRRGDGRTAVGHGTEHPFTLEYELP